MTLDEILSTLSNDQSTQKQKSEALQALRTTEQAAPFFSTESTIGSTLGGVLGLALGNKIKPLRKLSEKLFSEGTTEKVNKKLASALEKVGEKLNVGPGTSEVFSKIQATPTMLQMAAAPAISGLAGGVGGFSLGHALGPQAAPAAEAGRLEEDLYNSLLDVLTNPNSSAADKQVAYDSLLAQGKNTEVGGLSTAGKVLALGGLGTLLGGYAGARLGERLATKAEPGSIYHNAAKLLNEGQEPITKDMLAAAGEHVGEGAGDAIGFGIGAAIPLAFRKKEVPESYKNTLDMLYNTGNEDAKQVLSENYDRTGGSLPLGELIGTKLGGLLGAAGGAGHSLYNLFQKGKFGKAAEAFGTPLAFNADLGLKTGYYGAGGGALGALAGSNYSDPYEEFYNNPLQ